MVYMDINNFYELVLNMDSKLIFIVFFNILKDIQILTLIVSVILNIFYTTNLYFIIMKLIKLE